MTASLAGGQRPLAAPTKRGMPRIQSQCRVAAKDRNTQPPLALGAAFLFQAPVCTHADRALYRKSADAFLETRWRSGLSRKLYVTPIKLVLL